MGLELYGQHEQKQMYEIYDLIKKNNSHNALSLSSETGLYISDIVKRLKVLCIYGCLEVVDCNESTLKRTYELRDDFISSYGIIQKEL